MTDLVYLLVSIVFFGLCIFMPAVVRGFKQ